jgi:hypothetical protein
LNIALLDENGDFPQSDTGCVCEDTVPGWADSYGDDCQAYSDAGWCGPYGGWSGTGTDGSTGTAGESCCACGGGAETCPPPADITSWTLEGLLEADGVDCSSTSILCAEATDSFELLNEGCYGVMISGGAETAADEVSYQLSIADVGIVAMGDGDDVDGPTVDATFCLPFDVADVIEPPNEWELCLEDPNCGDDEATMSEMSGGLLSSCAAFASYCEDDSALVLMGAPAGFLKCMCRETCGVCPDETEEPAEPECEVRPHP